MAAAAGLGGCRLDDVETLAGNAQRVGNVTTATIPGLNKDVYQVGVRAIDRGPVAYPIPAAR